MAAEKGSFVRRDLLQQIEIDVQKKWEKDKIFEVDAPTTKEESFMCTFPFPYMNGKLHIGHAFTVTKAVFAAHYERLLGKKVLFPFGFHCTGMPIQAAANKLKRELDTYGSPYPTFPAGRPAPKEKEGVIEIDDAGVTILFKPPCSTGKKAIKCHHLRMRLQSEDKFKDVLVIMHPSAEELKGSGGKIMCKAPVADGGVTYQVSTELADGSRCPDSKESDEVSVDGKKKDAGGPKVAKKILAKTGDAATQYEILLAMGMHPDEMTKFAEPMHWLEYFPPIGVTDLKRFGAPIDFRRSFITTSVNPYYDSFIRWQFLKLKAGEKIGFGKRPTIYSETDGQACMDHDRSEGEGVAPQEYTAIKMELKEFPPSMKKLEKKKVFLLAATLRPETMPGQTNCWILPEGTYGCFQAGDEVWVCSQRAARNMSFQDKFPKWGKTECLQEVKGQDLLGKKVTMPTSVYEHGYLLPLLTIKMDKGTGVVTSVPSDSPDDYAAFMDLLKPGKLGHFGLQEHMVKPFEVVPIIDVEIDGEMQHLAAKYMCDKLGVASQKDTVKLLEAHDVCYKLGFDKGIMSTGPFKGAPVKQAKFDMRKKMVEAKQAFIYSEPEKKVIGRSGDECVVAGIDQWYLKYGEETWKKQILTHLKSDDFTTYNDRVKDAFETAIGWLGEWACSRSFGLGTRVPWDEQFLIESLSDSTIYMAYYTVCHFLQGNLDGSKGSPLATIKPEEMTPEVWDYLFLKGAMPKGCKIKKEIMEKMRNEFNFWYPMNLRVSGKDLVQNHLTMALYNHAAVWPDEPEKWPKSMFCNGWLQVNNEKMSKSKGNFFLMEDIVQKYSADATRIAMANSGDTLLDANFDESVANQAVLKLAIFLDSMKELISGKFDGKPLLEGKEDGRFVDRWFANELNRLVVESKGHYASMQYREALRTCYYEFSMGNAAAWPTYVDICKAANTVPNKGLTMRFLEWQMIILAPMCPHFCEHGWGLLGKKGSVLDSRWPEPATPVDASMVIQGKYVFDKVPHAFIKLQEKTLKQGKATAAVCLVAKSFPEWKLSVLAYLRKQNAAGKLPLMKQEEMDDAAKESWKGIMKDLTSDAALKPFMKLVGPFAAFKRDEAVELGVVALDSAPPFDELKILGECKEYLKDKLHCEVTVKYSEEATADQQGAAATAEPGKPAVHFVIEGGKPIAAKAPAGGGGAKGGGAAAKKPAAANFTAITDLKKLNDLLAVQTYIDGGAGPNTNDIAQFAATPSNVDREKFPHAARWHAHINHFSAAAKAKW